MHQSRTDSEKTAAAKVLTAKLRSAPLDGEALTAPKRLNLPLSIGATCNFTGHIPAREQ